MKKGAGVVGVVGVGVGGRRSRHRMTISGVVAIALFVVLLVVSLWLGSDSSFC